MEEGAFLIEKNFRHPFGRRSLSDLEEICSQPSGGRSLSDLEKICSQPSGGREGGAFLTWPKKKCDTNLRTKA